MKPGVVAIDGTRLRVTRAGSATTSSTKIAEEIVEGVRATDEAEDEHGVRAW